MNMKKTTLALSLAAVMGCVSYGASAAAVGSGDLLSITAGVPVLSTSGNILNISSGSFFAMDGDGNSKIAGTEKVPLSQGTTGLVIGTTTTAGSFHVGAPTAGDSGSITAPWNFFGNTGDNFLDVAVTGSTTAGLDLSGWSVAWNTVADIPMGGGAWLPLNCSTIAGCSGTYTDGNAHFTWDGLDGGAYTLSYTGTVPIGDPSGFGGVGYVLYLEGNVTVGAVPVPAAVWLFGSGLLGLVGVARRKTKQARPHRPPASPPRGR
jgi:hypothetical protein